MRPLTASIILSGAAALALAPAASAQISSIVTAPGRDFLATDQPVALRMKVEGSVPAYPAGYTVQAYVWPTGNGPTLELDPLHDMYPGGSAYQGGTTSGPGQSGWAARPGTYWIGVLATPKPSPAPVPAPCPPLPTRPVPAGTVTPVIACPQVSLVAPPAPQMEGVPHSKVTVHAPLTLMWARFAARQKAARIGWRSKAPMTCSAPYVSYAYACTFRWHAGRAHRLVRRAVTVTQDQTTGRVTVART